VKEDYPTTKINFPAVYNPDHYGEDNPAFKHRWTPENPIINQRDWNNDTFLDNYLFDPVNSDGDETDPDVPNGIANRTCLVPFVYLQEILKKVFNEYKLFGEFVENSAYQQLLVYNNYSLDGIEGGYDIQADTASHPDPDSSLIAFGNITTGAHMQAQSNDSFYITIQQKGYHKLQFHFEIDDGDISQDPYYQLEIVFWWNDYSNNIIREFYPQRTDFSIDFHVTFYATQEDANNAHKVFVRFGRYVNGFNTNFTFKKSTLNVINYSQSSLNRFAKEINLANHVPSKEVNEVLIDLKELFAMPIFIDNVTKNVQLFLLKDIQQTGIIDITNKVIPEYEFELNEEKNQVLKLDLSEDMYLEDGAFKAYSHFNYLGEYTTFQEIPEASEKTNIVYVASQNTIYKTQDDEYYGNIWKHYTDIGKEIEAYETGEKENKKIKSAGLLMRGVKVNNNNYYIDSLFPLPKIKQRGISIIYDSGKQEQDYPIRLFNWIGKKTFTANDGDTNTYVASTSSEYDRDGNQVSPFSLFLNGPNGILEYFHRPFLDFMKQTETVTVYANPDFNIKDLLDLIEVITLPQNKSIANQKRWVMIDNVKYLPRKMDVELSGDGIQTVQLELIKKANN
jgi:hypothetical protein